MQNPHFFLIDLQETKMQVIVICAVIRPKNVSLTSQFDDAIAFRTRVASLNFIESKK